MPPRTFDTKVTGLTLRGKREDRGIGWDGLRSVRPISIELFAASHLNLSPSQLEMLRGRRNEEFVCLVHPRAATVVNLGDSGFQYFVELDRRMLLPITEYGFEDRYGVGGVNGGFMRD